MKRWARAALPLLTLVLLTGCAGQAPANTAAVVDGQKVPTARYHLLVSSGQKQVQNDGLAVDWSSARGKSRLRDIQTQSLQLIVRDVVIQQMAKRDGVQVSDTQLDQTIKSLEAVAGGSDQLDQELSLEGLTRSQYRPLLRITLLDRELRARDPKYDQHLASAVSAARVQAYVGPCAADHQYPRCINGK